MTENKKRTHSTNTSKKSNNPFDEQATPDSFYKIHFEKFFQDTEMAIKMFRLQARMYNLRKRRDHKKLDKRLRSSNITNSAHSSGIDKSNDRFCSIFKFAPKEIAPFNGEDMQIGFDTLGRVRNLRAVLQQEFTPDDPLEKSSDEKLEFMSISPKCQEKSQAMDKESQRNNSNLKFDVSQYSVAEFRKCLDVSLQNKMTSDVPDELFVVDQYMQDLNSRWESYHDLTKSCGDLRTKIANSNASNNNAIELKSTNVPTNGNACLKKKRVRCSQCKIKLNITNKFECRCGKILCGQHRYSECHDCDWK